ncbi:Uncharacterized conserved protein YggE, contains kinase-interacting SIMPL domain [Paracoccus isoporae]|uniref:Uncharacterized conserved protein YggE, contains kinase-interacting SIMPL domain n=1 Tax=Paracoccus isoporae TaxID=591205 RepID=A0A1G7A3M2_9RHOB|nr:SIMPL domain-containing protein [Paracoccus isoporae]SDE09402.1 Uncharacterized conserved protein YggE, contains kinase-interacting SIMPL domain [Paracoccus isoporae]
MPRTRSSRLVPALLGSACTALIAAPAVAAPGGGSMGGCGHPGMLTITGHGESRVAPDQVLISLGVTTQADTADQAMQDNSERQQSVLETLGQAGVAPADIQTSGLTLNPMMNYPEDGAAPSIDGYMAQNLLTVRVTEIARVGEVLDSIVDAGANEMQGIRFVREDSQTTEDEALRMAVEDATHRAGVMASAAGAELGRIMRMGEPRQQIATPGPLAMRAMDASGAQANSIPVEGGEVAFTADVEVTFSLGGDDASCAGKDKPRGDGKKGRDKDRDDRKDRDEDRHGDDRGGDMTRDDRGRGDMADDDRAGDGMDADAMNQDSMSGDQMGGDAMNGDGRDGGASQPAPGDAGPAEAPQPVMQDRQLPQADVTQPDTAPAGTPQPDSETGPQEAAPADAAAPAQDGTDLLRPEDIMPIPDASAGQSADAASQSESNGTAAQPAQN